MATFLTKVHLPYSQKKLSGWHEAVTCAHSSAVLCQLMSDRDLHPYCATSLLLSSFGQRAQSAFPRRGKLSEKIIMKAYGHMVYGK